MRCAPFATACALACTALVAAAGQAPQSVWDGVYTAEQARRGGMLAADKCVACHGDRLAGGESAPPLAGDQFNATWEGVTLSDLFDRIRMTMPLESPGSLSRQQTADILAYMLSVGSFPAGTSAMATDAGVLGQIRFISNRPQP